MVPAVAEETTNEAQSHPEVVARLTKLLEQYVNEGRSTPGAKQANDAPIQIRKKEGKANSKNQAEG